MSSGLSDRFVVYEWGSSGPYLQAEHELYTVPFLTAWHATMLAAGWEYLPSESGSSAGWTAAQLYASIPAGSGTPVSTHVLQRTYRLNDALASTAPIYLRAIPMSPAAQGYSNYYRTIYLGLHFGRGSAGAASPLVNQLPTTSTYHRSAVDLGPWYDNRFAWTSGPGYSAISVPEFTDFATSNRRASSKGTFLVERTTDVNGDPTDEGFAVIRLTRDYNMYSTSNNIMLHSFHFGQDSWYADQYSYMWVPVLSSHNPGDHLNTYPIVYLCGPKWYQMVNFVGHHYSEAGWGEVFQLDTGIGPLPFLSSRQKLGATGHTGLLTAGGANSSAAICMAMRWEP